MSSAVAAATLRALVRAPRALAVLLLLFVWNLNPGFCLVVVAAVLVIGAGVLIGAAVRDGTILQ